MTYRAFLPATAAAAARPLPPPRCVAVGLIGPGHVGRALLAQLRDSGERLLQTRGLGLELRAIADSRHMQLVGAAGDDATLGTDLELFARHLCDQQRPAVVVDCSASDAVADRYAEWLGAGIHVVTPNKCAGSGPLARWQAIRDATRASGASFLCETTVGAGLPVVGTLRDMLDTGDRIVRIDGMLSGTLAWLCNRHDGSRTFSALVAEARELGYTEPDPRDDLSGMDVARKLVILARETGLELELEQVQVENLVPEALRDVPLEAFLARLPELDADFAARLAEAGAAGGVLRHVASLDADGRARVGLQVVPRAHALAQARLTDNVVQFTTHRYRDNPLVVQGPGAGPEVTAAGVFADVLRAVSQP